MKILFYLRLVVMGGAEKYLLTLIPALKQRNIDVGFFCTLQDNNHDIVNNFSRHFTEAGIPVYVCKAASPVSLKAARHLAQVVKREQYTVVSAHLIHAEIIGVLSKLFFNLPCKLVTTKHGYLQQFMDVHGLDHLKLKRWTLSYQVEKFLQYFVADNFAVSQGLGKFYVQSGICQAHKIKVIYHGMDATEGQNLTAPIRYSNNQLLIVARLRKFKGHQYIIEAVKLLSKEIPDLKLVILGKGEEMEALQKLVNTYALKEWIIFEGFTDNVYRYINGSDVMVTPSLAEPFGLTVLEAYSCAKPVVAFNVTAFNETIIDGETGSLAQPYDVEELAQKIKYLLQNKTIATQWGLQGKKLLETKFSFNEMVRNTEAFFRQL